MVKNVIAVKYVDYDESLWAQEKSKFARLKQINVHRRIDYPTLSFHHVLELRS